MGSVIFDVVEFAHVRQTRSETPVCARLIANLAENGVIMPVSAKNNEIMYGGWRSRAGFFFLCHTETHINVSQITRMAQIMLALRQAAEGIKLRWIKGQVSYQFPANCHIKIRPTATFILRKMAEIGNKLRTMTLWESEDSTGMVSLGNLFENPEEVDGESHIDLDRLAYLTCRGGWPKAVLKKSEKAALAQAFNYYDSVVSNDIKRVDDVDRDEELTKRIMRS